MLPPIYKPAKVRSVTRGCCAAHRVGIAIEPPDGKVQRYALSRQQAEFLRKGLEDYLALYACQSPRSSEIPSRDGSPQDGQSVVPLAMSSAAPVGLWYEPSPSPSNNACQRPSPAKRIQKVPARVLWLKATMRAMVLALSVRGWWNFHSRKVSSAARQAPEAIDPEAPQRAREAAHA